MKNTTHQNTAPARWDQYLTGRRWVTNLLLPVLMLALQLATSSTARAATITTDQYDYFFPDTVFIAGAAFESGEVVTIQVVHVDGITEDLESLEHQPWTVLADGSGNFETAWDLCWYAVGASYEVVATGKASGRATAAFTDSPLAEATISPVASQCRNVDATFTLRVKNTSSATGVTPLMGSVIVALPANVVLVGTPTIIAPANWSLESGSSAPIKCKANSNLDRIATLGELTIEVVLRITASGPQSLTVTPYSNQNFSSQTLSVSDQPIIEAKDMSQPVVSGCPGKITVKSSQANALTCAQVVSWTEPTAMDNCDGSVSYISRSHAPGTSFDKGTTTVTYAFADGAGNQSSCSFEVVVVDDTAPRITCSSEISRNADGETCTASVVLEATATDNCELAQLRYYIGDEFTTEITSGYAFPVGSTVVKALATDPDGNLDECTFTVTVFNTPPEMEDFIVPATPIIKGSYVTLNSVITDPEGSMVCIIDWGDKALQTVNLEKAGPSYKVCETHQYLIPGVYTITVTVTDKCGGTVSRPSNYIVVYDPNGGFVTGGGWINSPAGASPEFSKAVGRANFGFVSKYNKGATVPTGETEFQFKAGNLNFQSASYDWLVISGAKAQYKGSGTINGAGSYGFILTAADGQLTGGGGVDKFRIKIWEKSSNTIVYDNQMGAGDDAVPTTALGGGSIVIHK